MSSSENPEIVERAFGDKKEAKEDKKDEQKGGFIEKVKDFIQDIGEKIEETIGFGKPTADVTEIHIPHINLKEAEIVVDVLVKNPNPVPIPLIDINYLIDSDGRKLLSGLIPDAGTIHAHGSETVKIPLHLVYDDIKNTYHDIQPGSIIPYRIKVDLIVDVPVFGRLTLPLEKTGEIPIPYKPDIDLEKIHFERFSFEETVAVLKLKLENKNDFDLALNSLDYDLWLSDVNVGGAELEKSAKIEKNGISYIDIPITFRPKDFGSALWDMIRGRGTGYTMKGNINVDTPFGAMKLPISKEGGTTRLKKNKEDGGEDDEDEENVDGASAEDALDEGDNTAADETASFIATSLQLYRDALANNDDSKVAEIEISLKSIENEKNELQRKVASLTEELSSERDRVLRISADFDNFRKRTERERLSLVTNAQGEVVEKLLSVLDNFERAKMQIKVATEGEEKINNSYQSISKQFGEILGSLGVETVETVGKPFDPLLHEAIMREDSEEFEEGVVLEEYRKGFKLGDRLLRPSMVKVSAGPGPAKPETAEPKEEQNEVEEKSEEGIAETEGDEGTSEGGN